MKQRIFKLAALMLAVVMMAGILVACGKTVSGSYEADLTILGQGMNVTYTFKGNKVEAVSKVTLLGNVKNTETSGTYEINENADGTMEITFDFEEESTAFKDGTYTFVQGEDYIKIGAFKYKIVEK